MARMKRLAIGLLAAAAPAALQAQEAPGAPGSTAPAPPSAPAQAQAPPDPSAPAPTPPRRIEFKDRDGNPLPPDVQRQLEEHFRKNPLPAPTPEAAPVPGTPPGGITVTGQRPRGSVVGDLPPERTLSPQDIRAYGAGSLSELLDALGPQVRSDREREGGGPVTLLNGRRVSDFTEIARIPPEAIERMEIFPEELALRYGYRADQKVVNVVTYERFTSKVAQLGAVLPTDGGGVTGLASANYLALRGDTRIGLGADYNRTGTVLESDRNLRRADGLDGGVRSLLPESRRFALNGLVSRAVFGEASSTLSGRLEASDSVSLLGPGAGGPLERDTSTQALHLGTSHNGRAGQWTWALTGTYDRTRTEVLTDVRDPAAARDTARSVNAFAQADALLSGPVLELPAGPVSASVRAGVTSRDFDGRSRRGGAEQVTALGRDTAAFQASIDVPIFSRQRDGASPVGALSVNANLLAERFSDVGTLRTFGYGASWFPTEWLGFNASTAREERAPTLEQLGAPVLVTPNIPIFDFSRQEVVDVARLFGANPGLRPEDRHTLRLGVTARPLPRTDLSVSVDYLATRTDDPIASFPIVTSAIEAAFPGRITRDASGRLAAIDARPVNFARSDARQVRWGVNFSRTLEPIPPGMQNVRTVFAQSEADVQRQLPPGASVVRVRAEPGSALARHAENMSSRLQFSLYHTWHLEDEIVVRDGLPPLDLLDGGALDLRGGRRRHQVEVQASVFKGGLGARIAANWRSGTRVLGAGGIGGADDLRFADLSMVNVTLFANLAERFGGTRAPQWLRGTRASLGFTNLFNSRPQVRDAAGSTPLNFQPAYLDPLGRSITFSLRKSF